MKSVFSWMFVLSMLWSSSAFAITIDARAAPYNNVVAANGVGISSIYEVRQPAMLALVGAYRTLHGLNSIPQNSQVQIIYRDGTKEKALVTCAVGTPCVEPVPGTQQPASGGGSGGGGGGGGGSGGGSGGWNPPGGCYGDCGVVEVGDPQAP